MDIGLFWILTWYCFSAALNLGNFGYYADCKLLGEEQILASERENQWGISYVSLFDTLF